MLVVLLIFTFLLSWTVFSLLPLKANSEKSIFIAQLQSDLYHIQSESISNQAAIKLTFYPISNKYIAKSLTGKTIMSRNIPPSIQLINTNTLNEIVFNQLGNTNRFGTVSFKTEDEFIQLTFQIGQGRFYVQEL